MENKTPKDHRVLVAMSGGVDSSVAAILLQEQGYNVIGITMKLWDYGELNGGGASSRSIGGRDTDGRCCSLENMAAARAVARRLNFPHYVIDYRELFGQEVINDFASEYLRGRTPNPCVRCNTRIKWQPLRQRALELGCEQLATGHYARIEFNELQDRWLLRKARDIARDQSYFLWGLSQEQLVQTIFPLGELSKPEVRQIARRFRLDNADKPDSQEICFISDNDYRRFLRDHLSKSDVPIEPGSIFDTSGNKVGEHSGTPYYTVGQRRGLGVARGRPFYVVAINPAENAIIVGEAEDLRQRSFRVTAVNWVSIRPPTESLRCAVRIRYRHREASATVEPGDKNSVLINFDQPERAITEGQSAVFYADDLVLGGGVIDQVGDK